MSDEEKARTECDCGLDLTAVVNRRPDIQVRCYHDGSLGLSLHPEETFIKVHPGDNLEVRWRLTYPKDGGPPVLYEIGQEDGNRGTGEVDRDRANAGVGANSGAGTDAFAAFAGEGASSSLGIPDGIEPLVGYRAWMMTDDDLLKSTAQDNFWYPGPQKATCMQQRDGHHVSYELFRLRQDLASEPEGDRKTAIQANIDRAIMNAQRSPERNCMCGFYALLKPTDVRSKIGDVPGLVYGRIKAWGKIGEYSEGFRAEQAEIDALYMPHGYLKRKKVKRIAKKYGVAVEKPPVELRSAGDTFPIMFAAFWVGLFASGMLGVALFHNVGGYLVTSSTYVVAALASTVVIDHFKK